MLVAAEGQAGMFGEEKTVGDVASHLGHPTPGSDLTFAPVENLRLMA
jgi:hypothetical protein